MRWFGIFIFSCCCALANAVSFSDIVVKSYLQQELKAKVQLSSTDAIENVNVQLASIDEFKKHHIPYDPNLDTLRVQVARVDDSHYTIWFLSTNQINTPVLYLLIDYKIDNTQYYKQYTVLLDPVAYLEHSKHAVSDFTSSAYTSITPKTKDKIKPHINKINNLTRLTKTNNQVALIPNQSSANLSESKESISPVLSESTLVIESIPPAIVRDEPVVTDEDKLEDELIDNSLYFAVAGVLLLLLAWVFVRKYQHRQLIQQLAKKSQVNARNLKDTQPEIKLPTTSLNNLEKSIEDTANELIDDKEFNYDEDIDKLEQTITIQNSLLDSLREIFMADNARSDVGIQLINLLMQNKQVEEAIEVFRLLQTNPSAKVDSLLDKYPQLNMIAIKNTEIKRENIANNLNQDIIEFIPKQKHSKSEFEQSLDLANSHFYAGRVNDAKQILDDLSIDTKLSIVEKHQVELKIKEFGLDV